MKVRKITTGEKVILLLVILSYIVLLYVAYQEDLNAKKINEEHLRSKTDRMYVLPKEVQHQWLKDFYNKITPSNR